ncbi:6,7-dimethyl-8-ribityllumazine synthase [Rhodospirillum centenum]|uniref:6,7-dimethyl-8-ribityllumazine synthase n=1 Tax=Rhodospirillum centenum (strain ATCC 51521 / SW) TaxID=414684 RepID=B6IMS5_RHOCS|nr:6,7-dimethyl-8-ribityllumazine synthase [Rhodospirillum centenum]ACI98741.1 6,7-dimethyl-8-ribityllumazine synthase [Rhodospirillum centenum SW]
MADAPHIMIVEARFYEDLADEMVRGAIAELDKAGATYERFSVPGAFEIPAAIQFAVRSMDFYSGRRRFDGYVALGCVIRGETTHYDYVCVESARGLQDLALRHTLAIGYGILTVENEEQAWARASVAHKNKGGGAARACLDMIELKRQFRLYAR